MAKKKKDHIAKPPKKRTRIAFFFRRILEAIKRFFTMKISIYYRKGVHFIGGYQGAGKTLFMSHLVNGINDSDTNYLDSNKYFFITSVDEFYQKNVLHYNLFSMFENSKQVAKLPTIDFRGRKLFGVIIDEVNLKYNKRLNRSKNYNNSFVGLIEMIITMRHQGVKRVYFIGQKMELQDTQLQSLFKYYHKIVFNLQKPNYYYYRNEDKFIIAPRKLFIENYIKGYDDLWEQETAAEEVKISYEDLKNYNTFGLADTYKELPELMSEYEIRKAKQEA